MINLEKIKSVHFIGIGGIGVSAIARMMLLEGRKVSGSDRSRSLVVSLLKKLGIKVSIGHSAKNVSKDCDLVVYTVAIPEDNPELLEARKRGIPTLTYPEALGLISKNRFTIAVSGTSGKTTTTAMIAKVMVDAGLDPTVIVGSLLPEYGTHSTGSWQGNFIAGKSKYLVVEADEYKDAFHNLEPSILVITNITPDHLDYFKNLKGIQHSFNVLIKKIPESGFIVCDAGGANVKSAVKQARCKIVNYSKLGNLVSKLKLQVPGEHNRQNAAAALTVASALGISPSTALGALNKFSGTWRRFEYKGKTKGGAEVYDDYAHNPEKVRAVLAGAREKFPKKKIIAVFQPHLYSRTKTLFDEFTRSFTDADEVILLPIYAAREAPDQSINSKMLCDKISNSKYFTNLTDTKNFLLDHTDSNIVIITIGAGDITELSDLLTR